MSEQVIWALAAALPADRFVRLARVLPMPHVSREPLPFTPEARALHIQQLVDCGLERAAAALLPSIPLSEVSDLDGVSASDEVLAAALHDVRTVAALDAEHRTMTLEQVRSAWRRATEDLRLAGRRRQGSQDALTTLQHRAEALARGSVTVDAQMTAEMLQHAPDVARWLLVRDDVDFSSVELTTPHRLSANILEGLARHPAMPAAGLLHTNAADLALTRISDTDLIAHAASCPDCPTTIVAAAAAAARRLGPDAVAALDPAGRLAAHGHTLDTFARIPHEPVTFLEAARQMPWWLTAETIPGDDAPWFLDGLLTTTRFARAGLLLLGTAHADAIASHMRELPREKQVALAFASVHTGLEPVILAAAPARIFAMEALPGLAAAVSEVLSDALSDDELSIAWSLLPHWNGTLAELIGASRSLT